MTLTSDASTTTLPATRRASKLRRAAESLLAEADIKINGNRPWDMQLNAPGVLERILSGGSLALGESYMDGEWEADRLDAFFTRISRARLGQRVRPLSLLLPILRYRLLNLQNSRRAWEVGQRHYDLGNDFYEAMLDPRLVYSCGYWKQASDLTEAQEAKLDLICRKLQLQAGMRLLDIGCGWGSLMAYAAERYDVHCVGVTVSKKQLAFAQQRYAHLPLEFRLQDYRALDESFDRIASVGMFEHVGRKNHRAFMRVAHRCLADDGLFLLHTIARNEDTGFTDPWISKYIFPNGELPTISQIGKAIEKLFVAEDLHNFGADYDKTLMAWHQNFEYAWPRFANELGERFHRQWRYYLLSCAGAFRARNLQLWQWTLSKRGIPGGCPRVD